MSTDTVSSHCSHCSNTHTHVLTQTNTQFYRCWHTKTIAQCSVYTHTHTHIHANTARCSPDISADRLWGQQLSYCVTLALAQSPALFNSTPWPPHVVTLSPWSIQGHTLCFVCAQVSVWVTEGAREREKDDFVQVFLSSNIPGIPPVLLHSLFFLCLQAFLFRINCVCVWLFWDKIPINEDVPQTLQYLGPRYLYMASPLLLLPGSDTDHGQDNQYSDMALCSLSSQLIFLNS